MKEEEKNNDSSENEGTIVINPDTNKIEIVKSEKKKIEENKNKKIILNFIINGSKKISSFFMVKFKF
jgi:hypothetical protein